MIRPSLKSCKFVFFDFNQIIHNGLIEFNLILQFNDTSNIICLMSKKKCSSVFTLLQQRKKERKRKEKQTTVYKTCNVCPNMFCARITKHRKKVMVTCVMK